MHEASESHTISLERHRRIILYVLYCLICLGLYFAIPIVGMWVLAGR